MTSIHVLPTVLPLMHDVVRRHKHLKKINIHSEIVSLFLTQLPKQCNKEGLIKSISKGEDFMFMKHLYR